MKNPKNELKSEIAKIILENIENADLFMTEEKLVALPEKELSRLLKEAIQRIALKQNTIWVTKHPDWSPTPQPNPFPIWQPTIYGTNAGTNIPNTSFVTGMTILQ